jgi:hypothetical protein
MMPMSGRTQPLGWTDKEVKMAEVQNAGLYRFTGDGEARCQDCVINVLEVNPGMRLSDWVEDEFGETACDACDATVVFNS